MDAYSDWIPRMGERVWAIDPWHKTVYTTVINHEKPHNDHVFPYTPEGLSMAMNDLAMALAPELKTSEEWKQELVPDTKILDHDGWDRANWEYSFYVERITKEEFLKRMSESTCYYSSKVKEWAAKDEQAR